MPKITRGPDDPIMFPSNIQASSQELFIPNNTTNNSGSYTCLIYNSVTGHRRTTVKNIAVF
ncbi:carcinoembryonic antigen-related cell adhesion molecule 1-like protein, partial [Cricetulus griseus]